MCGRIKGECGFQLESVSGFIPDSGKESLLTGTTSGVQGKKNAQRRLRFFFPQPSSFIILIRHVCLSAALHSAIMKGMPPACLFLNVAQFVSVRKVFFFRMKTN